MRFVTKKESVSKGCQYCVHKITDKKDTVYACKKYECPYTELDGYRNYDDYLEQNGMNVLPVFSREDYEFNLPFV